MQKPLVTEASEVPFFILSSGRSGSTLLRKLLVTNAEVNIPPESDDLIPKLLKFYLRYNHKSWEYIAKGCVAIFRNEESAIRYWGIEPEDIIPDFIQLSDKSLACLIRLFYNQYAEAHKISFEKWGDKTPFLIFRLSWVNLLYPQAKFIFLLRDSRAVVNSFLKMDIGYTLESATERWLKAVEVIHTQSKRIVEPDFLIIRYEDLVVDPENELNKVTTFLNVKRVPFRENISLGDEVLKHHQNIQLPIKKSFRDKWKSELSKQEIERITDLTRKELKSLGYLK